MKVAAEAKMLQAQGIDVIDLSVGEPDAPTPNNIKEAAIRAIQENKTRYTLNGGIIELKKAIAEKLKKDNNLEYGLNEIIVSCGAKQSIFNAIHTTVYTDDEVIIPSPYWVSYPEMVMLAHGTSVIVETREENGFKLMPEELEKVITPRTKMLILCNPSNPTGSTYTGDELHSLAEVCAGKDFYILSDEIYEKLVYDNLPFISFPSLNDEMRQRTILVNGVSKSYSMTGWRIGYTAAPEPVIKGIDKIQSHSTSNPTSISQYAALEAITGPQEEIEAMRIEFEKRRNYLFSELVKIKGISCYKSKGAFYLFPNISAFFGLKTDTLKIENSFDFAMYLLYEAHIAAVPGSAFGAEGFIRFSYATSMENLQNAVERLNIALSKLRS